MFISFFNIYLFGLFVDVLFSIMFQASESPLPVSQDVQNDVPNQSPFNPGPSLDTPCHSRIRSDLFNDTNGSDSESNNHVRNDFFGFLLLKIIKEKTSY